MVLRCSETLLSSSRPGQAMLGRSVRGAVARDDRPSDLSLVGVWGARCWVASYRRNRSLASCGGGIARPQRPGPAGVPGSDLQIALRWVALFAHIESFIIGAVGRFERRHALPGIAGPS